MNLISFKGEWAALTAAFVWAMASVVYTRLGQRIAPLLLNLVKGLIAIAFLIITLLIQRDFFPNVSPLAMGLLLLSGAIGIGLGDTFYFAGLNELGPRRTLLIESLAPPLSALLALLFLQERLNLVNWLGIGLTIAGVTWVVSEQTPNSLAKRAHQLRGVCFCLLAALGQAGGAVLSRSALVQSQISPLWSTLLRLTAGIAVLLVWRSLSQPASSPGQVRLARSPDSLVWSPGLIGVIALTAFFSTYLGILLQQIALKFTAAGIAQALSATSPLFVLPISLRLGESISPRAVLGVLVAIAGIALLFSGRA